MKLTKFLFALVVACSLVFSCKSEKKEASEAVDEAIEAVEDAGEEGGDAIEEGAAAEGESVESAAAAESAIEGETMGIEEMDVPEGVVSEHLADTPVVYPGCDMATVDETRSCSKEKFIAFLQDEFNHDLAKEAG